MSVRGAFAALLPIALVAAGGCRVGASWDPAITEGPAGATVQIENESGRRDAELLLVRDDGIVVLLDDRVTIARWPDLELMRPRRVPGVTLFSGAVPDEEQRDRLRQLSRYPFGLTDDQLATVLAAYGQTTLDVLR